MTQAYDLMVLGGGPGGYAAALRARALGLTVALIEREGVGGTCLHHGCIPSKSLLRSADILDGVRRAGEFGIHVEHVQADFGQAVARSQKVVLKLYDGLRHLIQKKGVDLYAGHGRLVAPDQIAVLLASGETMPLSGRRVVIATGSRVRSLPASIEALDGVQIYTSDEALLRRDLPASVVILGGGATGCEFAYLYAVYGVRVHLVECAPALLPSEDREVSAALSRSFRKRGIEVFTDTQIHTIRRVDGQLQLESTQGPLSAAAVLLAIGRAPNVEEIGCDAVGLALRNGAIEVDERMQTNVADIFAVGDVTTRPALAHGAIAQGVAVAEWIAGVQRPPVPVIPSAVYCQPQIASVGLTEEAARAANLPIRVGRFPFSANGKAAATGETEGFVKVITHATDDRILGAHIVGSEATELIGEFALAMSAGIGAAALSRAIHPHPTLSEAITEATGMVHGTAIHT
jgi:dihydrolipoamide dehydrogenase